MRIAVAAIVASGLFNHVNYNSMRYQHQHLFGYGLRHWGLGSRPIRLTNKLDIFPSFLSLLIPIAMQHYTCFWNGIYAIWL